MSSLLVTMLALGLHLFFQPYTVLFYNKLESLSLASVVFAQTMSMALVDANAQAASKIGQADGIGLRTIDGIGFTLVAVHLSVILAFMYAFLKPPPQVGARKTRGDTGRRTQAQPVGFNSTSSAKLPKRLAPGAGSVGIEMAAIHASGAGHKAQSATDCEHNFISAATLPGPRGPLSVIAEQLVHHGQPRVGEIHKERASAGGAPHPLEEACKPSANAALHAGPVQSAPAMGAIEVLRVITTPLPSQITRRLRVAAGLAK
jgi:hypothetical protein